MQLFDAFKHLLNHIIHYKLFQIKIHKIFTFFDVHILQKKRELFYIWEFPFIILF
jgi:hypothetical protein